MPHSLYAARRNHADGPAAIYSNNQNIEKIAGYDINPFDRACPTLFNSTSSTHVRARKRILRPMCGHPGMRIWHQAILRQADRLMEVLRADEDNGQDMSKIGFYYALDTVSQAVLGVPFGVLNGLHRSWLPRSFEDGNRHMYLHLAWPALFRCIDWLFGPSAFTYRRYAEDSRAYLRLCDQIAGSTGDIGSDNIFHLMQGVKNPGMSSEAIRLEAFSFIRGGGISNPPSHIGGTLINVCIGADTIATAIAATLFYVTQDRTIYLRVRNEVRSVFRPEKVITPGMSLDSCTYLRACVQETLRICPPGPGVFWRRSKSALVIDGVEIPAGFEFGVSIFALHHNPDEFPDPEIYRPERFLYQDSSPAFLPFLAGARSCPARDIAWPMMCLPLALLFREFDLETSIRRSNTVDGRRMFHQEDVFGSKTEGPKIHFKPRRY